MGLVHRYGRACGEQDHVRAGVLYSEIVRAIQDDEEAPAPSEEDAGALGWTRRYTEDNEDQMVADTGQ